MPQGLGVAGLLLCLVPAASETALGAAQAPATDPLVSVGTPYPQIAALRFEGNRVTREATLRHELPIAEGDPADPATIEAGRQSVFDLGLFREVVARTEQRPDGRVDVVYRVREKRYLLPIPRVDASSDRDVSYGAQLRWSNVWGLNHRLDAVFEQGDFPEDQRRREERRARLSYEAPFLIADRYDLALDLEHLDRVTPRAGREFDETVRRAEVLIADDRRQGRPRAGWILGGGVLLQDQESFGDFAPPSDGRATALVGIAAFRDERFHLHSETGRRFDLRIESAASALGSDYSYTRATANFFDSTALGAIEDHHTLHWLASAGTVVAGPESRNEFGLGGSGSLRGYESDFVQGNRYYYGAVEYLRPIRWDWLRLFITAEVGGADDDIDGTADGSPYASIGIGVRLRLPWFVNIEFEAGIAQPLIDGDGARFFAGGN
jgi:outer membrane protein assembly factor BamA